MKAGQFITVTRPVGRSTEHLPSEGKIIEALEDGSAWVSFMTKQGKALVLVVEKVVSEWLPEVIDETNDLIAKIKLLFSNLPERIEVQSEVGKYLYYSLTLRPAAGMYAVDLASYEDLEPSSNLSQKIDIVRTLHQAEGETMSEARRNLKAWLKENNYI